jgi:hypothetical protein
MLSNILSFILGAVFITILVMFESVEKPSNWDQEINIGEGNCRIETTIEVLPELINMGVLKWLNACFETQK